MIAYTLIGAQRCQCGAVVFHVATCPICGERIDKQARKPAFQITCGDTIISRTASGRVAEFGAGAESPLRSAMSRAVERGLAKKRAEADENTAASRAVEKIRAERQAKKDRWAQDYLEKNKGAL